MRIYSNWAGVLTALVSLFVVNQVQAEECLAPREPDDTCLAPRSAGQENTYEAFSDRIRASEMVSPLGSELFGDETSLYNGATEFSVVDVNLPGNSGLPVQVRRRLKIDSKKTGIPFGGFGAWDLDVPHLVGNFDGSMLNRWNRNAFRPQTWGVRCSDPFEPVVGGNLELKEVWNGFHMHIPGRGSQEVLRLPSAVDSNDEDSGVDINPTNGTYLWSTRDETRLRCVPMQNYVGEGFVAVDTSGTEYTFDIAIERSQGAIRRNIPNFGEARVNRLAIYLVASKVRDRHGNTVNYVYSSDGRLIEINAGEGEANSNDRRRIFLDYNGTGAAATIRRVRTDAGSEARTWLYHYHGGTLGNPSAGAPLHRVVLPDLSEWTYSHSGNLVPTYTSEDDAYGPDCPITEPTPSQFTLTIKHPAGAVGEFIFNYRQHYRSGIAQTSCVVVNAQTGAHRLDLADFFETYTLTSKRISHFSPGANSTALPAQQWTYNFPGSGFGFQYPRPKSFGPLPCTNDVLCPPFKTVTVIQPDGTLIEHNFGVRFSDNEGRLLSKVTRPPGQSALRAEFHTYMTDAEAINQPFRNSYGILTGSDDQRVARIRPVKQVTISQQGVDFSASTTHFDALARPLQITRTSSLGFTRTDNLRYFDHLASWTVGQIAATWDQFSCPWPCPSSPSGTQLVSETTYDPVSALPVRRYSHGKQTERRTYHSASGQAGLPWQIFDGSDVKKTTLSQYRRGIPRSVIHHDNTTESAQVDYHGEITSVTNAVAATTNYSYDQMGRLNGITYPQGPGAGDSWNATTIQFQQVHANEYGIPAGHWRHTVLTGAARTVTYFDGLWRPVLTRTFDTNNESGTRRMVARRFNHRGQEIYRSFPARTISDVNTTPSAFSMPGTVSDYDALGRPRSIGTHSELGSGLLSTTFAYLNGFQTQATDPRSKITTVSFQAYDQPITDWPVLVVAPEAQTTSILRDAWGKPRRVMRTGTFNGQPLSVARWWTYDTHQRLCKVHEPESGATVTDYDASNNVAWTASGLNLTSTTACQRESVPVGERSVRTYDQRNRLTYIDHPIGTADVGYSYFPDGALHTATTPTSTWTYTYNNRRLLRTETLVVNGQSLTMTHNYNANGHRSSLGYPNQSTVAFLPNALGEPSQAGGFADDVSYHPNGAIGGFRYGNNLQHTTTLTVRQMPELIRDIGTGQPLLQFEHSYDQSGNLIGRLDGSTGRDESRTMQYDGLNRLKITEAYGLLGKAEYTWDVLDNLRSVNYADFPRQPQLDTYSYDSNNRLSQIFKQVQGASITLPYSYDARGNAISRAANQGANLISHTHTFDKANRMTSSQVNGQWEYYWYDAHGRRTMIQRAGGTSVQLYGRDGTFLYESAPGPVGMSHVHLGNRLVASVTGNVPIFTHTDALGSIVRRSSHTGAEVGRSMVEPFGSLSDGSWIQGPGFTGHVTDLSSGLTYMQQRYQDSGAMRFLSVDPVQVNTRNGGNFNRYWYANNNPYKFVDPDGNLPIIPLIAVGVALFANTSEIANAPGLGDQPVSLSVGERAMSISEAFSAARAIVGGIKAVGSHITQRAATREAKREAGIPTSQQATSQTNGRAPDGTPVGRQQTYEVPRAGGGTETKSVQVSRDTRGDHAGMPQIEAGTVKPGGQTDVAGRPRIQNEDKVRVDFDHR